MATPLTPEGNAAEAVGFAPHDIDSYLASFAFFSLEEELNIAGDASVPMTTSVPANSMIFAVLATISTTITTATEWCVGDGSTVTKYAAINVTLTAGTKSVPAGVPHLVTAATPVTITTTGTPGAGKIRVAVIYAAMTHPASS